MEKKWVDECYSALNDDFNTPKLVAKLFDLYKIVLEIKNGKKCIDKQNLNTLKKYFQIFYSEILGLEDNGLNNQKFNEILDLILELREKERMSENYENSDYIRNRLNEIGINVKDKK